MPGTLHQGILWLIEDDPWLPFDLLGLDRPTFGTPVSRRAEVERDGTRELSIHPYFPDLVLVFRDPDDPRRGAVISVEAQEKVDLTKRWRIPVCQALLADEYGLPTWSVVVCLTKRASRVMRGWTTGPPPRFDALVLDREDVPRLGSIEEGRRRPCLAVLSAALHGANGDLDAARLGLAVARELPERKRLRYTLTILAAVSELDRRMLLKEREQTMEEEYEIWDIERRSGIWANAYRHGLAEGRAEGRELGRREGERAQKVTLVELITTVLELRGVAVDEASLEQLRGCEDVELLERWATRAREVASVADLFDT